MKHRVLPLLALLLVTALLAGCGATAQRAPVAPVTQTGQPVQAANPPATGAPGTSVQPTQPAPPPAPPQGTPNANPADMTVTLTVPAQLELAQGKPAVLAMDVRNNVAAMTITYNTGQLFDFWVTQNDKTIWRWSDGRMFTQVVTRQTLNADGTLHFEVQWDGKDSNGRPVPPGAYMVHARWTAHTELASTPQPAADSINVR